MDNFEQLFGDCSSPEELFWSAYVVVGTALRRYAEGEIGSHEAINIQHKVSHAVAQRGFQLGVPPVDSTEDASTGVEGS